MRSNHKPKDIFKEKLNPTQDIMVKFAIIDEFAQNPSAIWDKEDLRKKLNLPTMFDVNLDLILEELCSKTVLTHVGTGYSIRFLTDQERMAIIQEGFKARRHP